MEGFKVLIWNMAWQGQYGIQRTAFWGSAYIFFIFILYFQVGEIFAAILWM
jgi:hypothetical protein